MRTLAFLLLLVVAGCAAADAKPKVKPVRTATPGPLAIAPDGAELVCELGQRRL